ncbi:uncharacterized protein LOC131434576 [Malaya genurostris]|uniref:uncharacterized protein LOC131434576 n=1 Tax=Malaya genurostris TaxID=325434 RepID=UPI0026F392F6|nr:uncharacterized protein LOC131434576 [Malaya genurostris]
MSSPILNVILFAFLCALILQLHGVPVPFDKDSSPEALGSYFGPTDSENNIESNETDSVNGTHQELYVVKAIVYEVGILVNVPDNETEDYPSSEQQVDLTFFSSSSNKTHINLGNIPLPVATSVNGQVLTGIAPVQIGAVSDLSDILQTLPFTGAIVNITQTNTSYIELSKQNISSLSDTASVVSVSDLAKLPPVKSSISHPLIPTSLDQTISNLAASATV